MPDQRRRNGNRPRTFDHLVSAKKPAKRRFELYLDPEVAEELRQVREAHAAAEMKAKGEPDSAEHKAALTEAEARLKRAEKAAEDATFPVVLKALGGTAYERLQKGHPPRPDEKKAGLEFNGDTFPPALIAACVEEPAMTVEQATQLWASDDFNQGELMGLFFAAVNLNQLRPVVSR